MQDRTLRAQEAYSTALKAEHDESRVRTAVVACMFAVTSPIELPPAFRPPRHFTGLLTRYSHSSGLLAHEKKAVHTLSSFCHPCPPPICRHSCCCCCCCGVAWHGIVWHACRVAAGCQCSLYLHLYRTERYCMHAVCIRSFLLYLLDVFSRMNYSFGYINSV